MREGHKLFMSRRTGATERGGGSDRSLNSQPELLRLVEDEAGDGDVLNGETDLREGGGEKRREEGRGKGERGGSVASRLKLVSSIPYPTAEDPSSRDSSPDMKWVGFPEMRRKQSHRLEHRQIASRLRPPFPPFLFAHRQRLSHFAHLPFVSLQLSRLGFSLLEPIDEHYTRSRGDHLALDFEHVRLVRSDEDDVGPGARLGGREEGGGRWSADKKVCESSEDARACERKQKGRRQGGAGAWGGRGGGEALTSKG